jgi:hypothetical protein
VKGTRKGPKDRRAASMAQHPSTHNGSGEWVRGYNARRDAKDEPCQAATVRDPEAPDWTPEALETVIPARCALGHLHRGWHVSADGYAWSPDDDAQHCQFPPPTERPAHG